MQAFKTRWFARFARREGMTDDSLREALDRAAQGLVDADLGGGLIKQRVARRGQGRSGGYRVILTLRLRDRAVFLYGFAKNEKDNIGPEELATLRDVAASWLAAGATTIEAALLDGILQEVEDDHDDEA